MPVFHFVDTSGNVEGTCDLNGISPRIQIDLANSVINGALEVFVDPRWLNSKLGEFVDSTDTFGSGSGSEYFNNGNEICFTLDELIEQIQKTNRAIDSVGSGISINNALSSFSSSGDTLNKGNPLTLEQNIEGDGGVGVKSLGYFGTDFMSNLETAVRNKLRNLFDNKGEELFNEEGFILNDLNDDDYSCLNNTEQEIVNGSGSGPIIESLKQKDLVLSFLKNIKDDSETTIEFKINCVSKQIRNAVDRFKESGSGYENNGRLPSGSGITTTTTGYFEGNGTSFLSSGSGTRNYPAVRYGFQNQDEISWFSTESISAYNQETGYLLDGQSSISTTLGSGWKGMLMKFRVELENERVRGEVGSNVIGDNNPNSLSNGHVIIELYVPIVLVCSRDPDYNEGSGSGVEGSGSGVEGSGSGVEGSGSGVEGSGSGVEGSGSGVEGSGSGVEGSGSGVEGSGSGSGVNSSCGSGSGIVSSLPQLEEAEYTSGTIGGENQTEGYTHTPLDSNSNYGFSVFMFSKTDLATIGLTQAGIITSLTFTTSQALSTHFTADSELGQQTIYIGQVLPPPAVGGISDFGSSDPLTQKSPTFYVNPQSVERLFENIGSGTDYNNAVASYGAWEGITTFNGQSSWKEVFSGSIPIKLSEGNRVTIQLNENFNFNPNYGIIFKFENNRGDTPPFFNTGAGDLAFTNIQTTNFTSFDLFDENPSNTNATAGLLTDGSVGWNAGNIATRRNFRPVITFGFLNSPGSGIGDGLFGRIDLDEAEALGTFRAGETITYSVNAIDQSGISQIKSTLVVGSGNDSNVGELGSEWIEGSGDEQQEGSGISFNPAISHVFKTKTFTLPSNSADKQFYIETEITDSSNGVCKIYSDIEEIRGTSQSLTTTTGSGAIEAGEDVEFDYLFELDSGTLTGVEIAIVTGSGSGEVVVATESLAGASGSGTITIPDIAGTPTTTEIIENQAFHYKTFRLRLTPQGSGIDQTPIYTTGELGPILPGTEYIDKRNADFGLSENASDFQILKRSIKLLRAYDYYINNVFGGTKALFEYSADEYFERLKVGLGSVDYSETTYGAKGFYYYNAGNGSSSYSYRNVAFFGRTSDSSSVSEAEYTDIGTSEFTLNDTAYGRNNGTKVYRHPTNSSTSNPRTRIPLPEALRDDIIERFTDLGIDTNQVSAQNAKTLMDLIFIKDLWKYETAADFGNTTGIPLTGGRQQDSTLKLPDNDTTTYSGLDGTSGGWTPTEANAPGFIQFLLEDQIPE